MTKALVIVESPTKARTISKFLGSDFEVKASYGHVRDLPQSATEIPAEVKKEKWSRIGINVDKDFEPLYIIPSDKKKNVTDLKKSLKDSSELYLATDEDREGESISWHLLEVLKPKIPVKRLVFHEITREAIQHCLESPREVDLDLVKAQETRRIIDRLYGYTLSPLLWKKVAPRLSAGRVQSVAMRLLVERERARISFKSAEYWDLKAILKKQSGGPEFEAELVRLGGKKVATSKDFSPDTGGLETKAQGEAVHLKEEDALHLRSELLSKEPVVVDLEEKPYVTKPPAPFTTSTLQQEASRKLGFGARHTMSIAQKLYENGLITYMRTDSTTLSDEALRASRQLIEKDFGRDFLPSEPRIYKTKVKNAQEAHEAIRPAGAEFVPPAAVKAKQGEEAFRLYELIWKRTVASQMKDSRGTRISVDIACGDAVFRATGSTIEFAGFLRAYVEGSDDPEGELSDRERILPRLEKGEKLILRTLEALEHFTQPPQRYTEGSLIKELERLGIGRPSTWATIVDVVLSRDYAFKRGPALVPTFLAYALTALMEQYFSALMDYEFTARMEDDLDAISRGERQNLKYLRGFYFGDAHPGLKALVQRGEEDIDPRKVCGVPVGTDEQGRPVEVRIGRYGPFITNGTDRVSVPDNFAPDEMSISTAVKLLADAAKGPDKLGIHPHTQKAVYLKKGRYGPYVQMGEQEEGGEKPKMVSLLPKMEPESVTFEVALKLLELPKNLGKHPELGADVIVSAGRFGPYIKCGEETRSIPAAGPSAIEFTLDMAVELLKQPKRARGRTVMKSTALKELGAHPQSGLKISIKDGKYGPYVTDGKTNASLPKGSEVEAFTLEDAVSLIDQKAASSKGKKRGAMRKKSAKAQE